jgi:hypothetical protein
MALLLLQSTRALLLAATAVAAVVVAMLAGTAVAVTLPTFIASNMVLQRAPARAVVWGACRPSTHRRRRRGGGDGLLMWSVVFSWVMLGWSTPGSTVTAIVRELARTYTAVAGTGAHAAW